MLYVKKLKIKFKNLNLSSNEISRKWKLSLSLPLTHQTHTQNTLKGMYANYLRKHEEER